MSRKRCVRRAGTCADPRHFRRDAPLRDLARGRVALASTPVFKGRVATAAASLGSSSPANSHLDRITLLSQQRNNMKVSVKIVTAARGPGLRKFATRLQLDLSNFDIEPSFC